MPQHIVRTTIRYLRDQQQETFLYGSFVEHMAVETKTAAFS